MTPTRAAGLAPVNAAVLVSAGRNPVSGRPRACPGDAAALALGLLIAGDALRVLHAGDAGDASLADYLALGAPRIDVVPLAEGAGLAACLAEQVEKADLVLTGSRAETGAGSGLLPYVIANKLDRPLVAGAIDAMAIGSELIVRQFLPKGRRRRIRAPLPAVLTVHPLAGSAIRYAHARRVMGEIRELAPARETRQGANTSWEIEDRPRPSVRLAARDPRNAHARLMSAIGTDARGGLVAAEGSSVDKAQVVLNYLRDHGLIDF